MKVELLPLLSSLHLLRELSDELLSQVATISRVEQFSAGDIIFRQGDAAETVYFVCDGTVSIEICSSGVGCRRILTVGAGELLGWSPVLDQEQLTATARAMTAASLVATDARQLRALCEQNPGLGYEFMKRAALALAQRLNATRLQLLNVYGEQMALTPQPQRAT